MNDNFYINLTRIINKNNKFNFIIQKKSPKRQGKHPAALEIFA